jgi:hypothetical protein
MGPEPHPDDFMLVTVSLEFRAKLNPRSSDPPPFESTTEIQYVMLAANAADCLEKVVSAIRERRLYGYMVQDAAESHVGAGEWIEKTAEDEVAENIAHDKAKNGWS